MNFKKVDIENWRRKEYFKHYLENLPCTYSMTVKLDITKLKNSKKKLYPALLHSVSTVVNQHEEFRTAIDEKGEVGIFSEMMPCYTVFHKEGMMAKPNPPANTFPVSMIPWLSFEGFNLNLQRGYSYLLPIFTFGKYYEENGKFYIPLSIQVHHAVCDGFHTCRFVNELQEVIDKKRE